MCYERVWKRWAAGLLLTMLGLNGGAGAAQQSAETTVEDQSAVAVTVYNNNMALVRDRRTLRLPEGASSLRFRDVAEQIIPQTVSLRSLNEPGSLAILEQNYEYDLMSPQKLMEKYVGREVRLISTEEGQRFNERRATLLSMNNGPVYRIDGEIYLGHPGNVVLPELPENLIARPTLVWLLDNARPEQDIEAAYLTRGLSWQADYVMNYDEQAANASLEGWVTLENGSGASYENATLKVVAGDVNVVTREKQQQMMHEAMAMRADAAPMRAETFGEYHLYTLPRRTTIRQNQSKQVALLSAAEVPLRKHYEVSGGAYLFTSRMGELPDQPVNTYLVFENDAASNLGMALPEGVIRVYQRDSSGELQFAGEDRVDHTPKDETVKLRLGAAFDLKAERRQTDFQVLGKNLHEVAFEMTVRNHKKQDVTVSVLETLPGDWEIREKNLEYTKRDARTAKFELAVPAGGETVLKYRARIDTAR